MQGRFIAYLGSIRSSFWFIPALMSAAAVALSVITISVDQSGTPLWLTNLRFIFMNQPGGARSLLSTIAGSMMNVAGVVFSLTIVALTLASQQFGPRLMGNFMRDRGNQVVLGTFVATFLYCLLVLRTVHDEGDGLDAFVPHLSVTVALLLAVATIAGLIYFIHHIASSIQVETVVGKVAGSLGSHIAAEHNKDIFPGRVGRPLAGKGRLAVPRRLAEQFDSVSRPVAATGEGYFQAVDGDGLLELARKHDAVVRLRYRPGAFILRGQTIADVFPGERSKEVGTLLLRRLSFGTGRNQSQDTESLFDQFLELARRALSPSTSDPFTAISCVNRIAAGLLALTRRELPSPLRADEMDELRLIVPPFNYPKMAARIFADLRSYVATDVMVASHVLLTLRQLAAAVGEKMAEERAAELGEEPSDTQPGEERSLAELGRQPTPAELKSVLALEYLALLDSCKDRLDDADLQTLEGRLAVES
ncbi:MAG: DUF2254 domain-containing protein [Trueperaceae bacterium]